MFSLLRSSSRVVSATRCASLVLTAPPPATRATSRIGARRLATDATGAPLPQLPIPMPQLSPTMRGGSVVRWRVREGERVRPEQIICEIETDTLTEAGGRHRMQIESHEEGIIAKIFVGSYSEHSVAPTPADVATSTVDAIPINAVIAVFSDSDDDAAAASVAASADANWGTRVPTSARFDPAAVGLAAGAPLALGGRRKGPFCWQAYVAEEPAPAADAGGSGGCCMK